jgi:hypothetical protein
LPNPGANWGDAIHKQYYDFIVEQGLPAPNKPGRPYYDWSSDWKDNAKAKYFSSEAEANKYSGKIKNDAVLREGARVGIDPKAQTPSERIDNYNKVIQVYGSKIKNDSLSETEKSLLNKYKSSAIIASPKNIVDARNNYLIEFNEARVRGIQNLSSSSRTKLANAASQIKSFDTKDLSQAEKDSIKYIGDVQDAIDKVDAQRQTIAVQKKRVSSLQGKEQESARNRLFTEEDTLQRYIVDSNQKSSKVSEELGKIGLSQTSQLSTTEDERLAKLSKGLSALSGSSVFATGDLAYKLNSQVTDQQIIDDINTAKKKAYKDLYDIGTQAATDLSAKIAKAKELLPSIPKSQQATAGGKIKELETQLATVKSDTAKANNLYTNYTPVSGNDVAASVAKFRDALRLPEQRTIDQINEIDPTVGATVKAMSEKYKAMAETPLGPTTTAQTEKLRNTIEQEAINELRLGSTIGAEERRGYEQSIRGAQTARGNVFGLGPAVQEAASIGMAGEQRKLARYGAATSFLASGETTGAAAARDIALRNALEQGRLGAAQNFVASGPTMYNLGTQRLGTQQNLLNNYLAASQAKTTGTFQGTPSATTAYNFVNPNAGIETARTAANTYGNLLDYGARTYSAYAQAQATTNAANSFPSYLSAGADLLKGAGSLGGTSGFFACWVAREVYGADNPKWLEFREWMFTKASDNLRNFYLEYGERIAKSIRNKPKIKAIIRKWMDGKIG